MKYYRLTDKLNFNEVIKDTNTYSYRYYFGLEKWVKTGIMIRYQWPEDELFDEYEEISETAAFQLLSEQRERLKLLHGLAEQLAAKAHAGQVDKGGQPYIKHPLAVANMVGSTEQKIVALLHDSIEDTFVTEAFLRENGFTERIIQSIVTLTKDKTISYEEYLSAVKMDNSAWIVKMADLKQNMDLSRIPQPKEEDFKRLEKYEAALSYLESFL
ncbi:HD domain-containing protein [Enterococcus sp. LJL51]|uniref:HD domain-containing protein n=1 Tax=Enterococcus sp. LJL51 TaxID=3416656 RepID=UPI003CF5C061